MGYNAGADNTGLSSFA